MIIFSEQHVHMMMELFTRLSRLVGEMGLARKRLEEASAELRRHQGHLEAFVKEATAALVEAKEEAARANRAKSVFLANMSDRVRSNLIGSAIKYTTWGCILRAMAAPENGAERVRFEVEGCGQGIRAEGQAIPATRAVDPALADGLTAETQDLHYGQFWLGASCDRHHRPGGDTISGIRRISREPGCRKGAARGHGYST